MEEEPFRLPYRCLDPQHFFFFSLHLEACGMLVPQPGIEPMAPALGAQSPTHWTAG